MLWLSTPPGRGCGAHELASDPYVQSCSETEQDVHGLLPSHLQSNTISTLSSQRETPHQPRLDTVASCSGDPNLILRARQMSHCQRGQPLMSLCKTERGMAAVSRQGLTAWDVLSLFLAGCSDRSDDGATSLSSSIDTARSGRCVGWGGAGSEQNVSRDVALLWAK